MSAPKYDIHLTQGESFYLGLSLDDDGVPLDLRGHHFAAQVRATPEAEAVLANFGFELSEAAQGTVTLTLAAAVTERLPVRACVYDLFMVSPAGLSTQLLRGDLIVAQRVTRQNPGGP